MTPVYEHDVFDENNMYQHDDKLIAFFSYTPTYNETKSVEAGRKVYDDVETITIISPGQRDTLVTEVTETYKRRFQKRYDAWKARMEAPESGTPLTELPWITPGQVQEFAFFNVKTCEQLLAMPETSASKFMGFQQLKQRIQRYVDASDAKAPAMKMEAELNKRDEEIAALKDQVAGLIAAQKASESKLVPQKSLVK